MLYYSHLLPWIRHYTNVESRRSSSPPSEALQVISMPTIPNKVKILPDDMSDKKSPPRKQEKPLFNRTQPHSSEIKLKALNQHPQPLHPAPIPAEGKVIKPQHQQPTNPLESKTAGKVQLPDQKALKRKLNTIEANYSDDDDKKVTPKRKKPINPETPQPVCNPSQNSRQPSGITSPRQGPLSERQQIQILKRLTDETSQDSTSKPTSPQQVGVPPRRTPGDKKVHKRNERGETPLHLAAIKGDLHQTKKLLKAGADVNVSDFAGWTPLHEASSRGYLSVAKQLLKAGANVNVQGLGEETPLHDAAGNGHTKLVVLLLKHGADPTQANHDGKTPLDVAPSQDIVKLLKKETIDSGSESSSFDEIRSPTSPESNASLKDEDGLSLDTEDFTMKVKSGEGGSKNQTTKDIGDKLSPHRLFMKFQRDPREELNEQPKRVKVGHFTSYSVTLAAQEASCSSPASSLESDLYDPHIDVGDTRTSPLTTQIHNRTKEREESSEDTDSDKLKIDLQDNNGGSESVSVHPMFPSSSSSSSSSSVSGHRRKGRSLFTSSLPSHNTDVKGGGDIGEFDRLRNLEPDSQTDAIDPAPGGKYHLKMMETQPFSPAFSDNDKSDSDSKDPTFPSISSCMSSLASPQGRRGSNEDQLNILVESASEANNHKKGKHFANLEAKSSGKESASNSFSTVRNSLDSTVDWSQAENPSSTFSSVFSGTVMNNVNFSQNNNNSSLMGVTTSSHVIEAFSNDRTSPCPRRNSAGKSISANNGVSQANVSNPPDRKYEAVSLSQTCSSFSPSSSSSQIQGTNSVDKGANIALNSSSSSSSSVVPGLKWDLRSVNSPKPAEEGTNPSNGKGDFKQDSPTGDKEGAHWSPSSEGKDKGDNHGPPKVPPLKIIINPKVSSAPASVTDVKPNAGKQSLPYVINPTQEQVTGVSASALSTQLTDIVGGVVSSSPASSRPSSRGSAVAQIKLKEETAENMGGEERDSDSGSKPKASMSESSKEREEEKESGKGGSEEEKETSSQRSTRTLRSHTAAQQQKQQTQEKPPRPSRAERQQERLEKQEKQDQVVGDKEKDKDEVLSVSSRTARQEDEEMNMHPRKRKLRPKQEPTNQPATTTTTTDSLPVLPPVVYEKPRNPYELYLSLKKQVASRRQRWSNVPPKPPSGFKDYLLNSCSYVLQGNNTSTLSVPMLSAPHSVTGQMRDLFTEQEKARYKLRLRHLIEKEKLMLANEQEVIREHGKAARAMTNQPYPFSMCSILREEEIYNTIDTAEQSEEKDRNVRSRFNTRQFLSWVKDVDDKYEKIKESLVLRHHHEAESLYAVQRMDWEFKLKELGKGDNSSVVVDELHVPMVQVNDEFELHPT